MGKYNVIDGNLSEIDDLTTVLNFILHVGGELLATLAVGGIDALSVLSSVKTYNSGYTADPNEPDTGGDGLLDGIELMFKDGMRRMLPWTLNPLIAADGNYDSDRDGITDLVELNLQIKAERRLFLQTRLDYGKKQNL